MLRARRLWSGTLLKLNVIVGIVRSPGAILLDALSDAKISTDAENYCRDWHNHPDEDVVSSRIPLGLG